MIVIDKKTLTYISGFFIFISGITHLIVCFLALENLTIYITSLIYGIFLVFIGLALIITLRIGRFNEKNRVIVFCIVVMLLNGFANLVLLITENVGHRILIYGFLVWHVCISFSIFPIIFYVKTDLDKMNNSEKISFFSIILVKGLGLNYTFQVLRWIGLENQAGPNYFMISYCLIFGIINSIIGELLYRRKDKIPIQILSIIIIICCGIIGVILWFSFPEPSLILFLFFHLVILPIRIYYLAYLKKNIS